MSKAFHSTGGGEPTMLVNMIFLTTTGTSTQAWMDRLEIGTMDQLSQEHILELEKAQIRTQ